MKNRVTKKVTGDVVGDVIDKGSEKWVYLKNGAKSLEMTVADGTILPVAFSKYGVPEHN